MVRSRDVRRWRAVRATASCAGRVRLWIPLLLLFWSFVWIVSSLARGVEAAGFTTVDTRRARLSTDETPFDSRWEKLLSASLARESPVSALDPGQLERAAARVAALPFVAEVGTPSVVWPDSFELRIRLRAPVACVRQRDHYLAVAADGVILPGEHTAPPWLKSGFLPVLGPNDGSFDHAVPGQRLREPRHVDALDVAISMRENLSARAFETMGPPLIDASHARAASVDEPGIVLKLGERRAVVFGRAPNAGQPGELPVDRKWSALTRALARLVDSQDARDWEIVDVRWDVPAIQWREVASQD